MTWEGRTRTLRSAPEPDPQKQQKCRLVHLFAVISESGLRLEQRDGAWGLAGSGAEGFGLVDEYLAYLADRNYSPKTVRAYGFDLLAFCRWLLAEQQPLATVTTEVLLRFLRACREATVAGRPGPNVVRLSGRRMDQYAAATINRRLAAISGLFAFVALRDPTAPNPVPKGREARWRVSGERSGMLAHTVRRPKDRSSLRLREPRRLPAALSQAEAAELLASFRTWRDRAIAGLMLYCGLRSAEVLGLDVVDVDIGGRWLKVTRQGPAGTAGPAGCRRRLGDPGLLAGRAARIRPAAGCSWWPRDPAGVGR